MTDKEILVVKKEQDKMKFKVCDRMTNGWSPRRYEKIIANKDYNLIAYLLYDLHSMGYPIEKSFHKFKSMLSEPELFFLK